jgi:hypothetical protein
MLILREGHEVGSGVSEIRRGQAMTKLDEIREQLNRSVVLTHGESWLLLEYIDAVEEHIFGNGEYRASFDKFKAARRQLGLGASDDD